MNWDAINFDWNHVKAFLATAETGSLTAAAKELSTTQPTLSRQIAALETDLSVTLFERVGRGLVLTASGHRLRAAALGMAHAANDFSLQAAGQANTLSGKVVISSSEIDAIYRLPNILTDIHRRAPEIVIDTRVSNDVADLRHRQADIAIRSFRPEQPDLIVKRLGTSAIGLFGAEAYVDSLAQQAGGKDGSQMKLIGYDNVAQQMAFLNTRGWQLTENNFPLTTANQLMQIELAIAGNGLIFLPLDIGSTITGLKRLSGGLNDGVSIEMWLVCHRELRTNPAVKFVYDHVAHALNYRA